MRIAALADIHGNLLALEAVLADLRQHAPDLVVNLGDHVSGPLHAAATASLLMSLTEWIHIRGNHDRQLTSGGRLGPSDAAAANKQIDQVHRRWLGSLPATATLEHGVFLCHGTPESDLEYLLEEVTASGVTLATHDAVRLLAGSHEGLILCGHSHMSRLVRLCDGTVCVNPGSVGLPAFDDPDHRFPHCMENGSPHARYALLDRTSRGWIATFRTVEYDWVATSHLARENGRPDWAHALATGYAAR